MRTFQLRLWSITDEGELMTEFTATLECDLFTYEVKANISEMGVNVHTVLFGGEPLNHAQLIHFITVYGEADLDDEIMCQYDAWVDDQRQDALIEAWEIRRLSA